MLNERNNILDNDSFRSQLSSILSLSKEDVAKKEKIKRIQQLDDKALSALKVIDFFEKATVKEVYTKTFISKDSGYRVCKDLEIQGFSVREEDSSKYPNVKPTIYYSVSPDFKEIFSEAYRIQEQEPDPDPETKKLDVLEVEISKFKPTAKRIFDVFDEQGITANAMADKIGCHFSTVHKCFQQFMEIDLAIKENPKQQTGHGREGFIFYATPLAIKLKQRNNSEMNKSQREQDIYSANSDSTESQNSRTSYSDNVCKLNPTSSGISSKYIHWRMLNRQIKQLEQELISLEGNDARKLLEDMRKEDF